MVDKNRTKKKQQQHTFVPKKSAWTELRINGTLTLHEIRPAEWVKCYKNYTKRDVLAVLQSKENNCRPVIAKSARLDPIFENV